ncbi:hypothetical protein B0H11DRAFT_1966262 [Mycena galericulata]|nr:hypothetical protein B0H11DRAFT_1966262 [Mycena galericulata]
MQMPRRIDPDRLAVRLGPELTSEMDAFIVPGAKMPTFQVRQELVKKYGVDRRHIYDYFHSRGLRVAKEDKHLNLSHRMRKSAASRKPVVTPAASSLNNDNPVKPQSSNVPDQPASKPKLRLAPTALESTNNSTKRMKLVTPRPAINPITRSPRPATTRPAPALQITIPLLSSPSPIELSSDTSDTSDAADTSSSEDEDSPVVSSFDTLAESSSFDEDFDLELVSLGYPASEELSKSFGLESYPHEPTAPDSSEDLLSEFNELITDIAPVSANPPVSVRDSLLLPLDDLYRLSQNERMEFYNLVSEGIGPACGFEEYAGTYKAHMERLYSNRSHSSTRHHQYDNYSPPVEAPIAPAPIAPSPPLTIHEKENRKPPLSLHSAADSRPRNNQGHHNLQTAGPSSSLRRNSYHISASPRHQLPLTSLLPPRANRLIKSPRRIRDSVKTASTSRTAAPPPSSDPLPHERPLIWTSPIKHSVSLMQVSPALNVSTTTFMNPYSYSPTGDRPLIVYQTNGS